MKPIRITKSPSRRDLVARYADQARQEHGEPIDRKTLQDYIVKESGLSAKAVSASVSRLIASKQAVLDTVESTADD
jgi:hypothetical protein